jgi:hypothetical protein
MTVKRAQVVTPWIGNGTALNANRPQLARDYALQGWVDATAQPAAIIIPTPNLYTVEVVCADDVLAQIAADPNYQILWSEPT